MTFPGRRDQTRVLENIVDLLIERTKANTVRWQPADLSGAFIASIGSNSVTITGVPGALAPVSFPRIVVSDEKGQKRAQGGGIESAMSPGLVAPVNAQKLATLATLISDQMSQVDPVLYEVENALKED